ncbi:Hpt domain-containing protein, partial [Paracraurococcus ruber]|nr:hypothetical protein [Paracraurococcus ruber]
MDDLLADFLTETNEGLVALDAALVRLERTPQDAATLSEVFRIVHTIKGTCGFLGLTRMESVAHAAENVLGRYRDGTRPVTQQGISLILAALDRIRVIVVGLEGTGAEPAGRAAAPGRRSDTRAAPGPRWWTVAAGGGARGHPRASARAPAGAIDHRAGSGAAVARAPIRRRQGRKAGAGPASMRCRRRGSAGGEQQGRRALPRALRQRHGPAGLGRQQQQEGRH